MSDSAKAVCKDPEGHWLHICNLRQEGKEEQVKGLMEDPGHRCLNCNAVAKESKNLCNPSPFARA